MFIRHALAAALVVTFAYPPETSAIEEGAATPLPRRVREAPRRIDPHANKVGRLVPNLTLIDLSGKRHRLSDFRGRKATVIAMTDTTCPVCQKYLPRLIRMSKQLARQDVEFIFVNPSAADRPEELRAFVKQRGIDATYVHDPTGTIGEALGAKTTTEVFVLDAARTLVYRGAVDDQYGLGYVKDQPTCSYLVDAIDAVRHGRDVLIPATWAPGCDLDFEPNPGKADARPVTYHGRIARIVNQHCVECHRDGGVGPFALTSYDDVVAHAGMIRKVVTRRTMPPWFASGEHGQWANDRTLPDEDRADLLAWLAGNRAAGDEADAPLPRTFPGGWVIGEPDAVVRLPRPVRVKAEGKMPYKYVRVKTNFAQDKWVQAMEIRPTRRDVVHHVLVFIIPQSVEQARLQGEGYFAGYVPGNSHRVYRDGLAKRLPAGSELLFQLHYTPNGLAVRDRTELGLIFADEAPKHEVRVHGIANRMVFIPPNASSHEVTGQVPVPWDVELLSLMPHMHVRGKSFRYQAQLPGEREPTTLLDVPSYDFNWQLSYRFAQPVRLPRGTKLSATGWFDNSTDNPANPNPNRWVFWGDQTDSEMMIGFVEYYRLD